VTCTGTIELFFWGGAIFNKLLPGETREKRGRVRRAVGHSARQRLTCVPYRYVCVRILLCIYSVLVLLLHI
jgi:hypothetical protein